MVHQGESVVKSYGDRGIRQICIIRQRAHMPECAHAYARMCAHILKCGRMWLGRNWLGGHRKGLLLCKLLLPKIRPFVIIIHPSIIIIMFFFIIGLISFCGNIAAYHIISHQTGLRKLTYILHTKFTPNMFSVFMLEEPTQKAMDLNIYVITCLLDQ